MSEKNIDAIFDGIRNNLDKMDQIREKILVSQRSIIRDCSQIIKKVHRNDFEDIDAKFLKLKEDFQKVLSIQDELPEPLPKDYINIIAQELGEAFIFYKIVSQKRYPAPDELGISYVQYSYALADVIGELRRYLLKRIQNEELNEAFEIFDYMNEIYTSLFSLDYPKGLIPGLRRKVDVGRNLISKTEGELTISANIIKLNRSLELNKKHE